MYLGKILTYVFIASSFMAGPNILFAVPDTTPPTVSPPATPELLYDAAALSSASLTEINFNFNRDVVAYAMGPQCYSTFSAIPPTYPNMCSMGGAENTTTNSNSSNAAVETRRTQNLRDICNNDTSRNNARELARQRTKEGELLLRDENITQREENEFALAIAGDPNFVRAFEKLAGPPRGDPMAVALAGMCETQARETVDIRMGRSSTTTLPLRLSDPVLQDQLWRCRTASPFEWTPPEENCDQYNVTVTSTNVRTLFECSMIGPGIIREVSLCPMLHPPTGGSLTECRRLDEERHQAAERRYWEQKIPTCQATYNSRKTSCLSRNVALRAAAERRAAERERVRAECEARVREARAETLRVEREADDAAYATALEAEKQTRCFQPVADGNKRTLCAGGRAMQFVSACSGITNQYTLANESLAGSDPQHPNNQSAVISANEVLQKVKIFRQNYNNVFNPDARQADCMTRIGFQTICDRLQERLDKDNDRLKEVYSQDKMTKMREMGDRLKTQYRDAIERMLPGSTNLAKRQKLLARIDKVKFVRPEGNSSLMAANNSFALNACYPGPYDANAAPGFKECAASNIELSPTLMLEMGTEAGQTRLRAILLHEIGHSVAPDLSATDPVFNGLTTCLSGKVNLSSYQTDAQKLNVKKESVADWLAAEVMGGIIQSEGADLPGRTLAVANQMDQMMCSIIGRPGRESCSYDSSGNYRFENDPAILTDTTSSPRRKYFMNSSGVQIFCGPGEFTYPIPPDRFAIFTRSRSIRTALGCNDSTTGSASRVQSCSL